MEAANSTPLRAATQILAFEPRNAAASNRTVSPAAIERREKTEPSVDGREIARYICDEMLGNTRLTNERFKEIHNRILNWGEKSAFLLFFDLVRYNGPWDHKAAIRARWGKTATLFGVTISFDIWSNIHFGYVGAAAGFSRTTLLRAAGAAQAAFSKIPDGYVERLFATSTGIFEAADDPRDQHSIALGVDLRASNETGVLLDRLLKRMRANLGSISD
jgi:hypothetical protein